MDNTWYYTLSTISQTLAALLGLGAVFVVLRIQSLNRNISDYKFRALKILQVRANHVEGVQMPGDSMAEVLEALQDFRSNYEEYRTNEFICSGVKVLSREFDDPGHKNDRELVEDTYSRLNSFVSQRDDVIRMVKWPGFFTSLSIFLAILLLGLSDVLHGMSCLLLGVVVFSLFSFASTIRASWKILDAIKRLE